MLHMHLILPLHTLQTGTCCSGQVSEANMDHRGVFREASEAQGASSGCDALGSNPI